MPYLPRRSVVPHVVFTYVTGNPQPDAIGHTQTFCRVEGLVLCAVRIDVNWELTHP